MKVFLPLVLLIALLASGCSSATSTASAGPNTSPTGTPSSPTATVSTKPLFGISARPAPPIPDPTSAYEPPQLTSPPQYVVVKQMLSFGSGEHGTYIPLGATVYHWRNKITEVIGPDDSVVLIARDSEATQINTPGGGASPATGGLQVPNGALIESVNESITVIYDGQDRRNIIGTVVRKPNDFPYAPSQERDTKQQFAATQVNADGSVADVTSQVSWISSNVAVATISPEGLVTAVADGHTQITASLDEITSLPVDLTVNTLVSISGSTWRGGGSPLPFTSLPVGSSRRVWADATYSDGLTLDVTSQVTWISADKSVAIIDSGGLITAVSPGNDAVTASLRGVASKPITFSVIPVSPTPTNGP